MTQVIVYFARGPSVDCAVSNAVNVVRFFVLIVKANTLKTAVRTPKMKTEQSVFDARDFSTVQVRLVETGEKTRSGYAGGVFPCVWNAA